MAATMTTAANIVLKAREIRLRRRISSPDQSYYLHRDCHAGRLAEHKVAVQEKPAAGGVRRALSQVATREGRVPHSSPVAWEERNEQHAEGMRPLAMLQRTANRVQL